MKNVLLVLLSMAGLSALAQDNRYLYQPSADIRLSPTVGMTSFDVSGLDRSEMDQGLTAGLLVDIGGGAFVFQTGLQYLQAGAENDFTTSGGTRVHEQLNLDYLGFPIMGKLFFTGSPEGVYLKAGAMPMISINSKYEAKLNGTKVIDYDAKKEISDTDVMAQAGVGFQVPGAGVDFGGEATFNRGLLNINDNGTDKLYNQGFMINAFISL